VVSLSILFMVVMSEYQYPWGVWVEGQLFSRLFFRFHFYFFRPLIFYFFCKLFL
jgi:hypothetical protein